MRNRLNLLATLSIATIILVLSVIRIPGGGSAGGSVVSLATLFHLLAYLGLAAAILITAHERESIGPLQVFLLAAGFGLAMEVFQYTIPYRSFAVNDILLNAAGASFVLIDRESFISSRAIQLEDMMIETLVDPVIGKHF